MPSELAKKAAGTFIASKLPVASPMLIWLTEQCRQGYFASCVNNFCRIQTETLDPLLVVVESVNDKGFQCRIPCRCYDHESEKVFDSEVSFSLDPTNNACIRL